MAVLSWLLSVYDSERHVLSGVLPQYQKRWLVLSYSLSEQGIREPVGTGLAGDRGQDRWVSRPA